MKDTRLVEGDTKEPRLTLEVGIPVESPKVADCGVVDGSSLGARCCHSGELSTHPPEDPRTTKVGLIAVPSTGTLGPGARQWLASISETSVPDRSLGGWYP
jgi:hypothetical protein